MVRMRGRNRNGTRVDLPCATSSAAFLGDGGDIVFADDNRVIRRWRVGDGQVGTAMDAGSNITSIAASVDGKYVVCGTKSGGVIVWDVSSAHTKLVEIEAHKDIVGSIDISLDSSAFATGSEDRTACVWATGTGIRQGDPLEHGLWVNTVKFSRCGNRVATAASSIRVYDRDTGLCLVDIPAEVGSSSLAPTPLEWSSDNLQIFAISNGQIRAFHPSRLPPVTLASIGRSIRVSSFTAASNGKFLVVSADSSISFWDTSKHHQIGRPIEHTGRAQRIVLSLDTRTLMSIGEDKEITLHKLGEILPETYLVDETASEIRRLRSLLDERQQTVQDMQSENLRLKRALSAMQKRSAKLEKRTPRINENGQSGDTQSSASDVLSQQLESELAEAREHAERLRTDLDACKSELFSANCRMGLSTAAFESWAQRSLRGLGEPGEKLISMRAENESPRVVVWASPRSKARSSDGAQKVVSSMNQWEHRTGVESFVRAFYQGEPNENGFLLSILSSVSFGSQRHTDVISRVHEIISSADHESTYVYVQFVGNMYMNQGEYERAIEFFRRARDMRITVASLKAVPQAGWSAEGLQITIQQHLQQLDALYMAGDGKGAAESFMKTVNTLGAEVGLNTTMNWMTDFAQKCAATFGDRGDAALGCECYSEAIANYSAALSLDPPDPLDFLIKRSMARATIELWDEALDDAQKASELSPSFPPCFERHHAALHGLRRYDEAISSFEEMLLKIRTSMEPEIRQLIRNYADPSVIVTEIDKQISRLFDDCPFVLIDVKSGSLCDASTRLRTFKQESLFKELVSSAVKLTPDNQRTQISRTVTKYFRYVMFSHTWEGDEPTFQQVFDTPVYDLDSRPLNKKLRRFCEVVRDGSDGFRWAWSDTCCINRSPDKVEEFKRSIRSMYKWYKRSALTLVLLADVSGCGGLKGSRWMSRAWTLQELLSPKAIRFYDKHWNAYLGDTYANHKESPEIMAELMEAVTIPRTTLVDFSPEALCVREKLRLAAPREATRKEDIAYSLIGIFSSDLVPEPREQQDALGLLLQGVVARCGDTTVLDWTGEASTFHSCIPASITVYGDAPYTVPFITEEKIETRIADLRAAIPKQAAIKFYDGVRLPRSARFNDRRLSLPCITFAVTNIQCCHPSSGVAGRVHHYAAAVASIGQIKFAVTATPRLQSRKNLMLVYPWIRDLLTRVQPQYDIDSDEDSDADSNIESSVQSDEEYMLALRLIAYLEQPFRALLLCRAGIHEYNRIATECEIVIPERKLTSLKGIGTEMLDIL